MANLDKRLESRLRDLAIKTEHNPELEKSNNSINNLANLGFNVERLMVYQERILNAKKSYNICKYKAC